MHSKTQQVSFYSLTELYHPKMRKNNFKPLPFFHKPQSQQNPQSKSTSVPISQTVYNNFTLLNSSIQNLQQIFNKRMVIHEQQIISIAHSQIKRIKYQSTKIIQYYSKLIQQKNINNQILDLKYQIKYYQLKACQLFQHNKKLEQENKKLKKEIELGSFLEDVSKKAMNKISKKYLREKLLRKNIISNLNIVNETQKSQVRNHFLSKLDSFKSGPVLIGKNARHKSLSKSQVIMQKNIRGRDNLMSLKSFKQATSLRKKTPYFQQLTFPNSIQSKKQSQKAKLGRIKTEPSKQNIPFLNKQQK